MKKIFNDLKLKFEKANWSLDPEFALIDTVLEQHPELFDIKGGSQLAPPVVSYPAWSVMPLVIRRTM